MGDFRESESWQNLREAVTNLYRANGPTLPDAEIERRVEASLVKVGALLDRQARGESA